MGEKKRNLKPLCMCAKSLQSCLTLCSPLDCSPQVPLSMGFSRQEYWSGLPRPPPGDFPESGIKPVSFMSLALASRFFTASSTWEDLKFYYPQLKSKFHWDWHTHTTILKITNKDLLLKIFLKNHKKGQFHFPESPSFCESVLEAAEREIGMRFGRQNCIHSSELLFTIRYSDRGKGRF